MESQRLALRIRMKKAAMTTIALFVSLTVVLAGCGRGSDAPVAGKVNVVTTFYPLQFLAEQIGGEDAHVVNLVPVGVEPHDWTPKSRDLRVASDAQLFIYNGAGLEGWTEAFLKGISSDAPLIKVEASRGIALIDGSGTDDGHVHGTVEEDSHDHDATEEGSHAHEDGAEDSHDRDVAEGDGHDHAGTDPHTWASPVSALVMAGNIRDAYISADPANKSAYESRYKALAEQLTALDKEYKTALAPHADKDIVVSHQAFAYLCRDYDLRQTAIMGLSPEAEPRSQDILRIIKFVKERQIRYIFFEQLASGSIAEMIARDTGAKTLVLNPLEGLTPEQERAGENLISLMRANLQNLLIALETH